MAYSVNWITRVITIPVSDMIALGGADYELPADSFWREIRRLEWDPSEGLWAPHILEHANTRSLAGETFVPENQVVNGYTVVMDPTAEKVFLKGDNNNIIDVLVFNGVSVIPSNSSGNTVANLTSDQITAIAAAVWSHMIGGFKASTWLRWILSFVGLRATGATTYGTPGKMVFYDTDGTTPLAEVDNDGTGNRTQATLIDPDP